MIHARKPRRDWRITERMSPIIELNVLAAALPALQDVRYAFVIPSRNFPEFWELDKLFLVIFLIDFKKFPKLLVVWR